ncbi:DUF5753 domain-containing protein [Saccharopolyspora shandongensis]|uniref:DUF5753 domain-containing protein n=1 Tax=Saccharopolyspora shandongensis TaxID=418495 RepID=UPI003408CD08
MAALLDFERKASHITDVSPLLIPGLLQTGDYARAIMVTGEVPAAEVETRVLVRVGRREVLTRRNPAKLLALVGETAIRQKIGDLQVTLDQLQHLLTVAEWPNVDLHVIPSATGWHPALEGPFFLIDFDDEQPIVHLENRRAALFFHEEADVAAYRIAVDRVMRLAMDPAESMKFIAGVSRELEAAG